MIENEIELGKQMEEPLQMLAELIQRNSMRKPYMTNKAFLSCVIIFSTAMYDKMDDHIKLSTEADIVAQATAIGNDIEAMIRKYTGIDVGMLLDEYTEEAPCRAAGVSQTNKEGDAQV